MSILTHSPAIVRDGLVLCLDAGAVRSYPGAGPQLVVNGDFASDITTGWEEGEATVSHDTTGGDGARLKIVGSVTGRLYSSAAITTVPGQKYRFSVHVTGTSTNHFVHLGKAKGGSDILQNFTLGSADGTYVWDFVATSTTSNELWIHLGATGSSTQYYDQVSLVAIASNLSLPGDSGFSSGVSYGVPGSNQWSDLSGSNNSAVINNMQYDLDASSGTGGTRYFDFDGSSDYMTISNPSFAADGFTNGLTCEAWLRFDTASLSGSDTGFITRYSASAQSQFLFGFREAGVGNIGLTLYQIDDSNNAVGLDYDQDWTPATDRWYHVVAVYIPSTKVEIFVDGQSEFSVTSNIPSQLNDDSTLDVMIGNYVGGTYFNGKMAILRMYNRALSIGEAQQNYLTHKGRFGL